MRNERSKLCIIIQKYNIHPTLTPPKMNLTLFYSSVLFGACIVGISLCVEYTEKLYHLYLITYTGILTSMLNHGTSYHSTFYKWLDRCTIFLGVFVYMYYIFLMKSSFRKAIALSIILAMIVLYFYSKYQKYRKDRDKDYTHIHLSCHFLSVMLFTLIVVSVR